jgi:hypothetical protein
MPDSATDRSTPIANNGVQFKSIDATRPPGTYLARLSVRPGTNSAIATWDGVLVFLTSVAEPGSIFSISGQGFIVISAQNTTMRIVTGSESVNVTLVTADLI